MILDDKFYLIDIRTKTVLNDAGAFDNLGQAIRHLIENKLNRNVFKPRRGKTIKELGIA
jgi:hypothetical protein